MWGFPHDSRVILVMYMNLSCIVKGGIGLIFGLLALLLPEVTLTTFVALFWVLIAAGIIIFLILATTSRSEESLFWFGLSAVLVIIGALSFFSQGIVTIVFMLIIAGVAFYSGFSDINYALEFPKTKYYLIAGMFLASALLFGVLYRYFPTAFSTVTHTILSVLGIFALIFGLFSIAIGLHNPPVPAVPAPVADPPHTDHVCACETPKEK